MSKTLNFKDFAKEMDRLARSFEELEGSVPFERLLTPSFMSRRTRFGSFEEMLDRSPFEVSSTEDFLAIPDEEWDRYVRDNTSFPSWDGLLETAVGEYVGRKLEI